MKQQSVIPAPDPAAVRHALGYIGEQEVCVLLGIEPPTLRNGLSIGTAPPSFKVGNRQLFKVPNLMPGFVAIASSRLNALFK